MLFIYYQINYYYYYYYYYYYSCLDMRELKTSSVSGRKKLNEITKSFRSKSLEEQSSNGGVYITVSIFLFIYQSVLFSYQTTNLTINLSIYLSINLSIHLSIYNYLINFL
jgi:hypothetical protein